MRLWGFQTGVELGACGCVVLRKCFLASGVIKADRMTNDDLTIETLTDEVG